MMPLANQQAVYLIQSGDKNALGPILEIQIAR